MAAKTQQAAGQGMYGGVELVTPDIAKSYLAQSRGNRSIRRKRLAKYLTDAREGRWVLTHQGLAFAVDGAFIDGHHRMEVVIESGMTLPFFVVRNVPREAELLIDNNLPRSIGDALRMAGMGDYTDKMVAAARALAAFPQTPSTELVSREEVFDIIEKHAEALTFACGNYRTNAPGVTRAGRVLAARAWYHVDTERLREWCEIHVSGVPRDAAADQAAVVYRNFLLKFGRKNHPLDEAEKYRKGQTCLDAFLHRRPLTKAVGTEMDLYPLPE